MVESPLVAGANADPERMKVMIVLGDDPLRRKPSITYCQRYAKQYARDSILTKTA